MNSKLVCNKIVVSRDSYNSEKDMFNAIGELINHLTRNGEECLVYADDINCGIYVIAHAHDNATEDWGENRFMLVTSDEEDEILQKRKEEAEEEG